MIPLNILMAGSAGFYPPLPAHSAPLYLLPEAWIPYLQMWLSTCAVQLNHKVFLVLQPTSISWAAPSPAPSPATAVQDWWDVPARFRRPRLDQAEVDLINSGGADLLHQ